DRAALQHDLRPGLSRAADALHRLAEDRRNRRAEDEQELRQRRLPDRAGRRRRPQALAHDHRSAARAADRPGRPGRLPGVPVVPPHLLHARGARGDGAGLPDRRHRLPRVQEGHDCARARRAGADARAARGAEARGRRRGARGGQRAGPRDRRPDDGGGPDGAGGPKRGPCNVKLDLFEGPLDLLLHLIKKNEVQITDIPIATITDQYLAMIEQLPDLNLDNAGEYLVMAATLMVIKSRLLLPGEPGEDDELEEDP